MFDNNVCFENKYILGGFISLGDDQRWWIEGKERNGKGLNYIRSMKVQWKATKNNCFQHIWYK